MVLIILAMVSGELIGHDDMMIFGKLHTDSSILQHLCKLMAGKTDLEFVALSCLFPSKQLREWYGLAVAHLDDIFLEVPTVQFPSLSSSVVVPIIFIAGQELLAGMSHQGWSSYLSKSLSGSGKFSVDFLTVPLIHQSVQLFWMAPHYVFGSFHISASSLV